MVSITTPSLTIAHREKRERHIFAAMERCVQAGRWGEALKLQRVYVNSFSANLVALRTANKRRLVHKRLSEERILQLAESANIWQRCNEKVHLITVPKGNGKERPTLAFGIRHKARHELVRRALEPFERYHQGQYGPRGRGGRDAACLKISQLLDGDFKFVLKLDIKNFFQSINESTVGNLLPLPQSITKTCVLGNGPCVIVDVDAAKRLRKAEIKKLIAVRRRGTLQYAFFRLHKSGPQIYLHRWLAGAGPGEFVHHVNGNGLDNRRLNLVVGNASLNAHASRTRREKRGEYRGVYQTSYGKFQVRFRGDHLGTFKDQNTAARVYDLAARAEYGRFAVTNFATGFTERAA